MNFSPLVRSWILLIAIVLGTGSTAGTTAFLGGADRLTSFFIGLGVGCSNVVMNLMKSPSDRVESKNQTSTPDPQ